MVRTRKKICKEVRQLEALLKSCEDTPVLSYIKEVSNGVHTSQPSSRQGYAPIHLAVALGQRGILSELLKKGVDMDEPDADGRTPLFLSVEYGRLPVIEALLIAGANAHARDYCRPYYTEDGHKIDVVVSPMQAAAIDEDPDVLHAFLKYVVDIDPTEPGVGGALHRLASVFEGDWGLRAFPDAVETVRRIDMCMIAGANIDLRGDVFIHKNFTPLQVVGSVCGAEPVVRALLRHGANANIRNGAGFNALLLATQASVGDDIFFDTDVQVVEALIAHGADVFAAENICGRTALHFAALRTFSDGIRALVAAGADVNARDKRGQTPLHEAAEMAGSTPALMCMKLLLWGGADETLADEDDKFPADIIGRETTKLFYVDESIDQNFESTRELLANAPAERAWRRRGFLVLCRAFPARVPLMISLCHARKGMARRTRSQAQCGFQQVLAALVNLTDDGIFRKIVCFL